LFPAGDFRELRLCFAVESGTRPALRRRASTRLVVARAHVAGEGFFSCMGEMTFATFLSAESSGGRCVCNAIHDVS